MFLNKILFIFCILFVFIYCEEEEEDSGDICDCEKNENQTCCFIEYQNEENVVSECQTFEKKYLFAINFVNEILNITCKKSYQNQTCGTNNPKKLFQCREHSSKSNTCCMLDVNGKTNCILADSKFEQKNDEIISDSFYKNDKNYINITCNEKFIYLRKKNGKFNLLLVFYLLMLFYL
jgi:hypothetical protein